MALKGPNVRQACRTKASSIQGFAPANKSIAPFPAPSARGSITLWALPPRMAGKKRMAGKRSDDEPVNQRQHWQEQDLDAIPSATLRGGLGGRARVASLGHLYTKGLYNINTRNKRVFRCDVSIDCATNKHKGR